MTARSSGTRTGHGAGTSVPRSARPWLSGIIAVVAVLAGAGCGSSSKSPSASSATTNAATPASSSTSATPASAAPTTSSTSSGGSSGTAPDACSLLTADQVGAVFAVALTSHSASAAGGGSGCNYDNGSGQHRLLVTTYAGSAYYNPSQQMQNPQSATGSWDKGAVDTSSGEIEYLAHNVTVTITDLDATLSAAQLTQLATESASKL